MTHATISHADLVRLEHLRNAGRFVSDMTAFQECHELPQPAQRAQLASLVFLITEQLDDVVTRCQNNWMNAEAES
ncbi:hypothetical protein ACIP6T_15795 [Pantoea sp. NPDC088449]|jgi:hypothetical protein|uniref:hypothetical protein n=1 Tax=Pantoea TaxID=53335 RepID=UPI000D840531|nr:MULTISPECIES: hypothetical protein [Pantoea]MRT24471.1 hypothetical protein [Enterobacteriaceae bacterium RIT697]MRT41796.1 hypothetical protein [Enterobacteriaceae bacterium RIT702]HDX9182331.1 hypothetical protein [Klebsiella michiganensis]MBY4888837.1 hypothetical protein [Pantoea sp. DY-15]MCW6033026.1 hypothetical protein [Pantoea sp. JK]